MTAQLDLFDQLTEQYEGTDLEYKAAKGGLPGSLWETYSAFANTDGGVILLGITERPNGTLDVHGVEEPHKLVQDFWNTVNNRGKVSRNLMRPSDVEILSLDEPRRSVVRINVRRADRHERPLYVGTDPLRGTYRRSHDGDYLCTDVEVRRMFADQSDEPQDSAVLEHFSFDDLHIESIRQFRNRLASRRPDDPWLVEDEKGLLIKLGGWRRDRAAGIEGVTLAGLLMFGKSSSITDPVGVPGFHLDYRERLSEDPMIRYTDRVTEDGSFECNLFQFYQRVVVKLSSGPGIKQPFQRDEQGYRQATTPVHEALQEALVNALIHADHRGQGGVVIERFLDRFVFSNPGTLLVSREQLLSGGVSECRNKCLQKMFQKLGVGDKLGSGIDKIRSSWKASHWRSPSFRETQRPDRVVLTLPMVSMLPQEVLDDLHRRFGKPVVDDLIREDVQALAAAQVNGYVTNQDLQEQLTLHRVDITRLLQRLVKGGFLVPDGIGRGRRYGLADGIGAEGLPDPVGSAISPAKRPISPGNDRISPVKALISPANDRNSPDKGPPSPLLSDPRLIAIARPIAESDRASGPQQVVDAILALCEGQFLTIRELAGLLNRKPDSLREGYVSDLLRQGRLELRYPDKLNHRKQGYRARKK